MRGTTVSHASTSTAKNKSQTKKNKTNRISISLGWFHTSCLIPNASSWLYRKIKGEMEKTVFIFHSCQWEDALTTTTTTSDEVDEWFSVRIQRVIKVPFEICCWQILWMHLHFARCRLSIFIKTDCASGSCTVSEAFFVGFKCDASTIDTCQRHQQSTIALFLFGWRKLVAASCIALVKSWHREQIVRVNVKGKWFLDEWKICATKCSVASAAEYE